MNILRKYFVGRAHYALVEYDDGTRVELKSVHPLTDDEWIALAIQVAEAQRETAWEVEAEDGTVV